MNAPYVAARYPIASRPNVAPGSVILVGYYSSREAVVLAPSTRPGFFHIVEYNIAGLGHSEFAPLGGSVISESRCISADCDIATLCISMHAEWNLSVVRANNSLHILILTADCKTADDPHGITTAAGVFKSAL